MKISIKLTQSQAEVLFAYASTSGAIALNRTERILLSIQQETYEKVRKFYLGFSMKNKPIKITFKSYQAGVLELFLQQKIHPTMDKYAENTLLYIIGEINQQLA